MAAAPSRGALASRYRRSAPVIIRAHRRTTPPPKKLAKTANLAHGELREKLQKPVNPIARTTRTDIWKMDCLSERAEAVRDALPHRRFQSWRETGLWPLEISIGAGAVPYYLPYQGHTVRMLINSVTEAAYSAPDGPRSAGAISARGAHLC